MSTTTNNITNNIQLNFIPVIINPKPIAKPEDLIWSVGPIADTTAGNPGTIFTSIVQDQVNPALWYHGGNPLTNLGSIDLHSCQNLTITNLDTEVISGSIQKGLFNLTPGSLMSVVNITSVGTTTDIEVSSTITYTTGMLIEFINSIASTTPLIPSNIYKVVTTTPSGSNTIITVDYDSSSSVGTQFVGTVNAYNYFWDEIYTTPLGLYDARNQSVVNPNLNEFFFVSNDSNNIIINISDPNIVPKPGDVIVIEHFFQNNVYNTSSTTDDLVNVLNFHRAETYQFEIVTVSATVNPLSLATPNIEYNITLDKSFKPILATSPFEQYSLILLNRNSTLNNQQLYEDTWRFRQVHREQLLGDPYNYTGLLLPTGRKNYLNYAGSEYLGIQHQISKIINNGKTPYVVLTYPEKIFDRIYDKEGESEVHLPCIMLQESKAPVILTNIPKDASGTFFDDEGAGNYDALYLKYDTSTVLTRYGWIFYDLRIIVIDHAELAHILGYNTNRNYTLPDLRLSDATNGINYPTKELPLIIVNVTNTTPIQVTTVANHYFNSGEEVFIEQVIGTSSANTTNVPYYAKFISPVIIELYQDSALTIPIAGNGTYLGKGILYSSKLAYEYFATYRIDGRHYKSLPNVNLLPFNYALGGKPNNSSSLASVTFDFSFLTHLVDANNVEGFEGDTFEIIIGKYQKSLTTPYTIAGIQDLVVATPTTLTALNLKTASVQDIIHQASYSLNQFNADVALGTLDYDLLNNINELLYSAPLPLPANLLTSNGIWNIGLVKYKQQAKQYRLEFEVNVPSNKWNATTNPSFEVGNPFMSNKLISELEFLIKDSTTGDTIDLPYVFTKISPPLKKTNQNDLIIRVQIDF